MVNMYSMGMMGGMYGMGSSYGMSGMYGNGGNVHQQLKSQYGVGYEDSGAIRPYAQPYPMAIIPRTPEPKCEKFSFCRFIRKCFS